ncbi:interferon-induced protein with tetratricopeptide repeats 1-like [Thunnus thynnus]|uniref:interferon-induced protein with tetratricopeptide repeats 1-like n=1 Tax=Thunnus thynnus TaxID=8237 RepID=UPI0035272166
MKGEGIEDEAHELARKVLRNPVSSYSGLKELLWVYRKYVSADEAVDLAEEALEKHPGKRFLKWCAALCYEWRILFDRDSCVKQSKIQRAIRLHKEVIPLYPHPSSSLLKKIALANIHAKSNHGLAEAEQIYQKLLVSNLEPAEKQMLYHCYAKYLDFHQRDYNRSEEYYMKAAKIPCKSFFRENSIKVLMRIKKTNRSRRPRELEEFLANLGV